MKRIFIVIGTLFALSSPALAANSSVPGMGAATSVAGTDGWYCIQSGGTVEHECTSAQIAAYIYSLMNGDATASGTGGLTLSTVNSNVGTFGSATEAPSITLNAKGLAIAASSVTITPAITSITGLGTGCAMWLATPSSANLRGCLTDETGTGVAYFVGGALGIPASGVGTNFTGIPISTALTGFGTGVAAALAIAPGTTGSFSTQDGAITTGDCLKWGPGVQDAGAACGSGGSTTITAGTTPTSGFTSGDLIATAGAVTTDSGIATSAVATLTGTQTLSNKTLAAPNITTGFTIGGSATSGNYARGNGTDFVSSAIQAGDLPLGSAAAFGAVKVDGTTITASGGVISATTGGGGTVTSVGAGCGTSTGGAPIMITGTVAAAITSRSVTTTTDTIVNTDCGNIVYANDASAIAGTIAQAGTTGFASGAYFEVCNINAGPYTLTPTTSTIGGASTLVINAGTPANPNCVPFKSNGTNYDLMDTVKGSGVQAAQGTALSAAGGLTSTIASGTATLGTSAIASGACATVVTVTATNVATTDTVLFGYNGDPTAVTGYGASAIGAVLTIYPYPTSGNVNVKVCNSTANSITPGSMTLNWRVTR